MGTRKSGGGRRRISRRRFLRYGAAAGAGVVAGGLFGCGGREPALPDGGPLDAAGSDGAVGDGPPPNIVYIYTDQHRADSFGAAGNPVAALPNLDALAAAGVTFGRCYTCGPLCRPARASMMTGRYPHEHLVWTNEQISDRLGPSHVRRIRDEAGYATALVGKAHLHMGKGHLADHFDLLDDWGFEWAHELASVGQGLAKLESGYTDWLTATTPAGDADKLERYRSYLDHYWREIWERPWDTLPPDMAPWLLGVDDHLDRYTGRVAADWIRGYDDERPFYLQVNFPGPHDPFDSTTGYRAPYWEQLASFPAAILEHPTGPMSALAEAAYEFGQLAEMTADQQRQLALCYYAKLTLIDDAIGEVVGALAERGRLDDTWIVYGSDHGEMLGDHHMFGKGVFYESAVNVPCVLRPPGGLATGWSTSALIDQLDVTATILGIAGLAPDFAHGGSQLERIAAGPDAPGRDVGREWVISEAFLHGMLRTERFKLVLEFETGEVVELFDLAADPRELVNRITDPAYAKTRDLLRDQLLALSATT